MTNIRMIQNSVSLYDEISNGNRSIMCLLNCQNAIVRVATTHTLAAHYMYTNLDSGPHTRTNVLRRK